MSVEAGARIMNDATPVRDVRNRLLAKLSAQDWALVAPHLENITLKERQVVEVARR